MAASHTKQLEAATSTAVLEPEITVCILNKSWATVHAAQIVCTHSVAVNIINVAKKKMN